ncbi:hypothetical protein ScPMuIL_003450 [Solemya velum]
MNVFLLLVALVLAYGIAVEIRHKKKYYKCLDDLGKCRKSARRPRKTMHFINLLMCQLQYSNCISEIPQSRLDALQG